MACLEAAEGSVARRRIRVAAETRFRPERRTVFPERRSVGLFLCLSTSPLVNALDAVLAFFFPPWGLPFERPKHFQESPNQDRNAFDRLKSIGGSMATTRVAIAPMKAVQVPKPGADFEVVEREIPSPGPEQVRIKVQACGVCHSDVLTKEGHWPGIQYPRVPGHEVAGTIDELGAGVTAWTKGQRVGVGWHGGHDNTCIECRRGRFLHCRNPRVAGITFDGRYQQYMVAPVEALAALPNTLSDAEAAPMLCAGVTTFNALRYSGGAGQPSRRARCRGPRPPRNPICKQV